MSIIYFQWHLLYLLVLEKQEKDLEKKRTYFEAILILRHKGGLLHIANVKTLNTAIKKHLALFIK